MKLFLAVVLAVLLMVSAVVAQTDSIRTDSTSPPKPALQPPAPVTDLRAKDSPDDHGHSITLTWTKSADDGQGANSVFKYEVFRWYPFYLDTMYKAQAVTDSLAGMRDFYRRFLPQAAYLLKLYADSAAAKRRDSVSLAALPNQTDSLEAVSKLLGAYQDSLKFFSDTTAIRAQMKTLPDEVRDRQRKIDHDWERAPQAHVAPDSARGHWKKVGEAYAGQQSFTNNSQREVETPKYMPDHCDYYYRVDAVTSEPTIRSASEVVGPVQSEGQFFNRGRTPSLFATGIFITLVVMFVALARKGRDLYVRPLAGIEAVDEAIGRATEMGKPILYVLGLGTAADIATIASFTVLGRVAKRVAEYQTELIVPTYDPIVMSVAQETIKSSYADAGRPDTYKQDSVFFVTQDQFAYVGAVNGIMLRQLPATNIYMGKFYAESLILAETGALAGSIQIAGTDEIAQIPFFVVACDYTLIGEELYAASAYLGREPILLGSLKAQDYAKAAIIILTIAGTLAVNFGWFGFKTFFTVVR